MAERGERKRSLYHQSLASWAREVRKNKVLLGEAMVLEGIGHKNPLDQTECCEGFVIDGFGSWQGALRGEEMAEVGCVFAVCVACGAAEFINREKSLELPTSAETGSSF